MRAFSDLLIKLRRELSNDLDLVLIMAVVAERHYAAASPNAIRSGINAHSVALYADMPRETVRRKVAKLIDRGWLTSDDHGTLRPAPLAASDLAHGTTATLKYLDAIAQSEV